MGTCIFEGVDIGSALELDPSLNFFTFLIYANFRTYVLKILTQPQCPSVTSLRLQRTGLDNACGNPA